MGTKRALIGVGFLYLFAVMGLIAVGKLSFGSNHLLLTPMSQDPDLLYRFDISLLDPAELGWAGDPPAANERVYVVFHRHGDRATPTRLTRERPHRSETYLRAIVRGMTPGGLLVHYGIEGFPIPASQRAAIDRLPRPFSVQIAVDPGGQARVTALVSEKSAVRLDAPNPT